MNRFIRIKSFAAFFLLFTIFTFGINVNKANAYTLYSSEAIPFSIVSTNIVKCYPNPAVSYINFSFDNLAVTARHKLIIYSFTGKKMTELNVNASIIKIDLSAYFRGVYIYQLVDAKGKPVDNGKFQVIK